MNNSLISIIFKNPFIGGIIFILIGWFLLEIKGILISLFVSYIIMATLSSFVEALEKKKLPRTLAVSISFILALTFIIVLIVPLVPFILSQLDLLLNNFPTYLNRTSKLIGLDINVNELKSSITSDVSILGKRALTITSTLFGSLFTILTILVVSFYMLLYRYKINRSLVSVFPDNYQKKAQTTITMIEEKLGSWVRGQIILSFAIGVLTYFTLYALGLPFALPLAILAGILEIVPTIGPILSAIPAVIVALNISPTISAFVVIAYIVIQLLENNILVPKVMEKAVGLNPIIIIISVSAGAKLLGIVGALLAVPFVSILIILFKTFK